MSAEMQYYVIGRTGQVGGPVLGLARRTYSADGPVDETLRSDLTWQPDTVITEWEYGDLTTEVIKVSDQDGERVADQLGTRWQRSR
jgi:hypothetical protein